MTHSRELFEYAPHFEGTHKIAEVYILVKLKAAIGLCIPSLPLACRAGADASDEHSIKVPYVCHCRH